MEVKDRESLITDTVANRLTKRSLLKHDNGSEGYVDEWFIPIFRARSGPYFVDMMIFSRVFYTKV